MSPNELPPAPRRPLILSVQRPLIYLALAAAVVCVVWLTGERVEGAGKGLERERGTEGERGGLMEEVREREAFVRTVGRVEREAEREEGSEGRREHMSDPLLGLSWHLHPTVDVPVGHISVEKVWEYTGFTGKGSEIILSGEVPDIHHQELMGRYPEPSDELINAEKSPTKTALLALALGNGDNGVCSRGVAFDAKFEFVFSAHESYDWLPVHLHPRVFTTGIAILGHKSGPDGGVTTRCENCWNAIAASFARSNQLVILVSSGTGGKESNCNYDMMTNSPDVIIVAPHTSGGRPASYAETCAAALVSAPSGEVGLGLPTAFDTNDMCTNTTHTHASMYLLAGVIALMHDASSHMLTRRETAHILVHSSEIPLSLHNESYVNAAGYRVHPRIGFGNVNALKAVKMSAQELPYPRFIEMKPLSTYTPIQSVIQSGTTTLRMPIASKGELRVDWVTVSFDLDHEAPHKLRISLVSPSGTPSLFAEPKEKKEKSFRNLMVWTSPYGVRHVGSYTVLNTNPLPHHSKWNIDFPKAFVFHLDSSCCEQSTCALKPGKKDIYTFYILIENPLKCSFEVFLDAVYDAALAIHGEISVSAIIVRDNVTVAPQHLTRPLLLLESNSFDAIKEASRMEGEVSFSDDSYYSFRTMRMTTVRNWGECAAGTWELVVENFSTVSGSISSLTLQIKTYLLTDI